MSVRRAKWRSEILWDYINDLKQATDLPWLLPGEFNEIMFGMRKKEVISVNRTICKLLGIVYQIVLWRISVLVVINLLGDVVA
jgi:hypothetical protein